MIVKAAMLFLIGMLVLGMMGKLRMPRLRRPKSKTRIKTAHKCPNCGNYVLGGGPCSCSKTE